MLCMLSSLDICMSSPAYSQSSEKFTVKKITNRTIFSTSSIQYKLKIIFHMSAFITRIYIPSQVTGNIYFQVFLYALLAYMVVTAIRDLYLQTQNSKWLKLSAKQKLLRLLLAFKFILPAWILSKFVSGDSSWWIIATGAICIFVGMPLMDKAENRIEYQKYSECPSGKAYLLVNYLVHAGWACTRNERILESHSMNKLEIVHAIWYRSGDFDGFNCQIDANYCLVRKKNKDHLDPIEWDLSEQAQVIDCTISIVFSLMKTFEREVFDEHYLRYKLQIAYREFFNSN